MRIHGHITRICDFSSTIIIVPYIKIKKKLKSIVILASDHNKFPQIVHNMTDLCTTCGLIKLNDENHHEIPFKVYI